MKELIIMDYLSLEKELASIPVDVNEDVLFFSQEQFFSLLLKFKNGVLTAIDLERIADLLECKDGIVYENEYIKESVHSISNIDIS